MTRWRPIPGDEPYEASSTGEIRSPRKILSTQRNTVSGYLYVTLGYGNRRTRTVHSLVLRAFHGPRPEGVEARHLDGNQLNNSAVNLTWGTHSENLRDTVKHGTNVNTNKIQCPYDHPYTPGNTRMTKRGTRRCKRCEYLRNKARRLGLTVDLRTGEMR